ncbi:MAG: hypothetical protein PF961_04005 [Planctomycetota bacterium]|jgi:hypothetical protein|nr:hypothetical protein [Planctomycetota bacterium]
MNDVSYSTASQKAIRVQLDAEILRDLVYGEINEAELRDERSRQAAERSCALREHQVYRMLRSIVSQFNGKLKGRRERFKLIEEGDGLIIEFSN